jgi:hypothetical protein
MSPSQFDIVENVTVNGPCEVSRSPTSCETCDYSFTIEGTGVGLCQLHVTFSDGSTPFEAELEFVPDTACPGSCLAKDTPRLALPGE